MNNPFEPINNLINEIFARNFGIEPPYSTMQKQEQKKQQNKQKEAKKWNFTNFCKYAMTDLIV